MRIKFKKLNATAKTPERATDFSAGYDLFATSKEWESEDVVCYGTGIAVEIPEGYLGLLVSRSSVSKYNLIQANCVGIIDSDYRGEIKIKFRPIGSFNIDYAIGSKLCQLIIIPYPDIEFEESNVLTDTIRGNGGFGSSDK